MISLDSILENIIAQLLVLALSFLVSAIFPIRKGEYRKGKKKIDPLKISIFLFAFCSLNLILNISFWNIHNLTVLFTILSILFGSLGVYISNNQCSNCKKFINAKKKIREEMTKEFTKQVPYQPMKIIKYSNGRTKESLPIGEKKFRTEKWERKREFYECSFCGHKWDSGQRDHLIFAEREAHHIIKTKERDPEESIGF